MEWKLQQINIFPNLSMIQSSKLLIFDTFVRLFNLAAIYENKIDNSKIFLVGFSQGGMICLQAGIKRKKKIKLVISYSGKIVDLNYLKKNISLFV